MYVAFVFNPAKTGDPILDSINRFTFYGDCYRCSNLAKKYWNPNLSKASNRANILNILDKENGKEPYYPMLPNGELDVEAYKLKLKKKKIECYEAQMREEEREAEERAYKNTIFGKLDRFLNDFPLLFWIPK